MLPVFLLPQNVRMPGFLRSLKERWDNWTGDHDMEVAIKKHLTANGYYGGSVELRNVRLVAVQRPGWLQVFRFEARAKVKPAETDGPEPEAIYEELFGLVREDARKNDTRIRVFADSEQRKELFLRWSEDLIQLRGAHGLL